MGMDEILHVDRVTNCLDENISKFVQFSYDRPR